MLARNEVIIKWALYAAAALLCVLVQGAVLQRIMVLGVIPFVYPLLAAIPATFESSVSATIFSLCVGVFCDLLLPTPIPCFYTLIFPLIGLCASLLSSSVLKAGFLCSTMTGLMAFLYTGAFQCFLLWLRGKAAWSTALSVLGRETLLTLPLIFPMTVLFRAVFRKTHMDD